MSKISNALFLSAVASPFLMLASCIGYTTHQNNLKIQEKELEKSRILSLSPEDLTLRDIYFVGSTYQRTRFIGGGNFVYLSPWGENRILIEGDLGIRVMQKRTDEILNECNVIKRVVIEGWGSPQIAEVDGTREPCLGKLSLPPNPRGFGPAFTPSKERV